VRRGVECGGRAGRVTAGPAEATLALCPSRKPRDVGSRWQQLDGKNMKRQLRSFLGKFAGIKLDADAVAARRCYKFELG